MFAGAQSLSKFIAPPNRVKITLITGKYTTGNFYSSLLRLLTEKEFKKFNFPKIFSNNFSFLKIQFRPEFRIRTPKIVQTEKNIHNLSKKRNSPVHSHTFLDFQKIGIFAYTLKRKYT